MTRNDDKHVVCANVVGNTIGCFIPNDKNGHRQEVGDNGVNPPPASTGEAPDSQDQGYHAESTDAQGHDQAFTFEAQRAPDTIAQVDIPDPEYDPTPGDTTTTSEIPASPNQEDPEEEEEEASIQGDQGPGDQRYLPVQARKSKRRWTKLRIK